jgi:hypothetical protein
MISPGLKSLGDITITAAGTQTATAVEDLDGMLAAAVQFRLAYGSGGTSVKAYLQTSLDQGSTWIDVACFTATTASAVRVVNLSALTPKTTLVTPTDGALSDDSAVDGILGDRLRLKVVSVGTYAGSTLLTVRAVVR